MNKVTYQDLYSFHFLSGVQYSPDGKHAIFSKHQAIEEKNNYRTELWLLDTISGSYHKLTSHGDERQAMWLNDSTVIFSSNRKKKDKDKKPHTDYYTISIYGGEAQFAFSIDEKSSLVAVLDNNEYLFTLTKHCEGAEQAVENHAQDGKDLLVFDEIYFWSNGQGIRNKIRTSLAIYNVNSHTWNQISPKYSNVGSIAVSPDCTKIAYSATEYTHVSPKTGGLYLYHRASSATETIVPQEKASIGSVQFLGNEKLFYTSSMMEFPGQNSHFYTYDLSTTVIDVLPYADAEIGGSVGTDSNYGGGQNKKFYNGKLYATRSVWSNSHLMAMESHGNWDTVCGTSGSITSFDIADNKVLMTAMRGMHLAEIYSFDLATGTETKLTSFNDEYTDTHAISQPEYFTFINRDGVELEGFVIKPVDYVVGQKYPAVFTMHGGPKAIFGNVFCHEMQIMASMGYFVFYTNPRGSDGRGSDFANITRQLGKTDFEDFMEFFDEVLKRYPDIHENRVGICGGSYGGFMCNWMIGHTDRFAAAASQRSISNYLTKALTTDIGYNHNMAQLGTNPWEDFNTVWETSPLKCAAQAKTPTLFIQSDEDYRCWMSDAIQMFTALKLNGVDARLALFHGENHELSRSGKPHNRISRLTEICNWFETYLKRL